MYYYDHRCNSVSPWNYFSESNDKLTLKFDDSTCSKCFTTEYECQGEDCDGFLGEEFEVEMPSKFIVCNVCDGKGKIVNPSIDANGLTQEDFAEDPEFMESYFAGAYDIQCNHCYGKRVIPTIDEDRLSKRQKEAYKLYKKIIEDDIEFKQQCHAELRNGC